MTIERFVDLCQKTWPGKVYEPEQRAVLEEKCTRFKERQLDAIFNVLVENLKYLPRVVDIYDAARELSFLEVPARPDHHWQATDCSFCHGEGRLMMIWEFHMEARDTGLVEIQEFRDVLPYSASSTYVPAKNHFTSIFRCSCPAGTIDTLPKAWPQWSKEAPLRREIWKS